MSPVGGVFVCCAINVWGVRCVSWYLCVVCVGEGQVLNPEGLDKFIEVIARPDVMVDPHH